jgi:hypothetical protein
MNTSNRNFRVTITSWMLMAAVKQAPSTSKKALGIADGRSGSFSLGANSSLHHRFTKKLV